MGRAFCPQPAFSRPWPPEKAAAAKIGRPTSARWKVQIGRRNCHCIKRTPIVESKGLKKFKSLLLVGDDPRIEAQPLYVPDLTMNDGKRHNVVFVATMATMFGPSTRTKPM